MIKSRLHSSFLKNRNDRKRRLYTKQRNYIVSRLKKKKKGKHIENSNERCVTDNRLSWKTIKPFLSGKIMTKKEILRTDKNRTTEYLN